MTRKQSRDATMVALRNARRHLELATQDIDAAGNSAMDATGDGECDMLACFASNTIQGSMSLLRELEAMVDRKRVRK